MPRRILEGSKYRVYTCVWGPAGTWLATGGGDYKVGNTILSPSKNPFANMMELPERSFHSPAVLSQISLWEASTGAQDRALDGHTSWVTSVSLAPSGTELVTVAQDRTLIIWKIQLKKVRHSKTDTP